MKLTSVKAKDRSRRILSHQAHEDIQSCIVEFIELCQTFLTLSNKVHITPGLTNSDVVENTFNQNSPTMVPTQTQIPVHFSTGGH